MTTRDGALVSEPGGQAWLVDGDDPILVANAVRDLVAQLVGTADRALAVEDFRDDEVDLGAVADACQTPPLLTDRRVVVIREAGRFDADEVAPLLAYLDAPLPTTSLVLAAGGGRVTAKLLAAVKAGGLVIGTRVAGREAPEWLRHQLARSPVRLERDAIDALARHLGEDLSRLPALIDVLAAAYPGGERLGAGDIEPYLGQAGAVPPWDLTDAVDQGKSEVALVALHRLLEGGGRHPLVVMSLLHRHFASMLRVDSSTVTTEAQAGQAMGIAKGRSTYPAKKALNAARRLGSARLAEAVGLIAEAELALKGAPSARGAEEWPPELVLEVLVARLCRLARAGRGAAPAGAL